MVESKDKKPNAPKVSKIDSWLLTPYRHSTSSSTTNVVSVKTSSSASSFTPPPSKSTAAVPASMTTVLSGRNSSKTLRTYGATISC